MFLKFDQINDSNNQKLNHCFGGGENLFTKVNPGSVIVPQAFNEIGEMIVNLNVRCDDVWMCSYPRTGKITLFNAIA